MVKYHYLQTSAHNMVRLAIQHGDLIRPECCSECGNSRRVIEAHHKDYSKPLDVIWLCRSCHLNSHGEKSKYFVKQSNASNIVRRHLELHPNDANMSARKLARMLGVGKSTVCNVVRETEAA